MFEEDHLLCLKDADAEIKIKQRTIVCMPMNIIISLSLAAARFLDSTNEDIHVKMVNTNWSMGFTLSRTTRLKTSHCPASETFLSGLTIF